MMEFMRFKALDYFNLPHGKVFTGPSPLTCPRDERLAHFSKYRWLVEFDGKVLGPFICHGVECHVPAFPIRVGEPIGLLLRDG